MQKTFLDNVNTEKLDELFNKTDNNVKYFNDLIKKTVEQYTKHLDDLMQKIYLNIKSPKDIDNDTLEKYYLELTNLLYFCGDKLEQLEIYTDLSKSAAKEVYNKSYLNNQIKDSDKRNKTTVAENTAIAEESAKYEFVINSIYDKAYKVCKYKIDAGYEMVNTLRKIITKRMQDEQFFRNNSKFQG